jgi:hypothetical protein
VVEIAGNGAATPYVTGSSDQRRHLTSIGLPQGSNPAPYVTEADNEDGNPGVVDKGHLQIIQDGT